VTSGHFCGQPDSYTVYFAARFNRPFSSSGTWGGTSAAQVTRSPGSTSVTEHGKQEPSKKTFDIKNNANSVQHGSGVVAGGWVNFDTSKNASVGMQVAVSYVSTAGALGNLAAEAHSWNVGTVAARATAAWNRQLGTIAIRGGSPAAQA
jgi:putative alpha-1,2-mannosidase